MNARVLTPPVRADVASLIDINMPTRPRALAVAEGVLAGRAWADDEDHPTWVVVVETGDGTVYAGGSMDSVPLVDLLRGLETMSGDLIFGFIDDRDPLRSILPPDPYYTGAAIDFTDRVAPADEDAMVDRAVLEGLRLVEIDAELLPRVEWYEDTIHAFGSAEGWTRNGVGYALLDGEKVVAQAGAGPRVGGLLEMGVITHPDHRNRGHSTFLSRTVARACEARGDRVWWNTSADNVASQAVARHLGFTRERRYDLVAYRTDAFGGVG